LGISRRLLAVTDAEFETVLFCLVLFTGAAQLSF
jgi:hypothetical protein